MLKPENKIFKNGVFDTSFLDKFEFKPDTKLNKEI